MKNVKSVQLDECDLIKVEDASTVVMVKNIHILNDIESNDSDDEDISSNGNVDPIEALDDFIQHVVEKKEVEKTPLKDPNADDSKPPGFEKCPIYNNDDVTSQQEMKMFHSPRIRKVKNSVDNYYIINVYGPQHQPEKSNLWSYLRVYIQDHIRRVILFGDLNEVRSESERFGSNFSCGDATIFNSFIHDTGLIDLPMSGWHFTWVNKDGSKMSKLDRFLISDDVLHSNTDLKVVALDRLWFDHNPILFHYFEDMVKEKWAAISDLEQSKHLHTKLKDLKSHLKLWYAHTKEVGANRKNCILATLRDLHKKIDDGHTTDVDMTTRINRIRARRPREARIDGPRIMLDGVWNTDPKDIKSAFLDFYKDKFSCHDSSVSFPLMLPAHRLSIADWDFLEFMVSMDEIKVAVWDCGSQKTSRPDGYSFMFIKKFWDLLKYDIQSFVVCFFTLGMCKIS
ncbi:RNA-directed DNA polymerase, eukaryota, reverse transcriptase zinc-binding domain protein [Tanacetum coccineum]